MSWTEIERVFHAALEIAPHERSEWLDGCAAGDGELAGEVRALLESHEFCEGAGTPRRIGAWRLERMLGRGGMGEVWLAWRADGAFEKQAALKLVRPGLGEEILLPRFHRERELLARLNHPNIALLLDGGVAPDGRPYLVTQYVEGEPLIDYCERRQLGIDARLELFRRLLSAVEYAHRNLVVHRDLKPANVLVTADGSPKLLDFGLARLMGEDNRASIPILTPSYASPEQLRGEAVATGSDVYSLGVMLFELLTGALPYEPGASAMETIAAITGREPTRASRIEGAGVRAVPSGDLDAILAKALEKSPELRYGSVESFSADIANYLEKRPVTARRLTRAYQARKYLRRHWRGATAAAGTAALLAASTLFSFRSARIADRQRQRAESVATFLKDILGAANPAVRRSGMETGGNVTLLEVMRAASQKISPVLDADPPTAAELRLTFANTYMNIGMLSDAEREIQAAQVHIDALNGEPEEKGRVIFFSGLLDYRRFRLEDAERKMRQGLEFVESGGEAKRAPNLYAMLLNNFAMALAARGKAAEAEQTLRRGVALMRDPPPGDLGVVENNLGLFDLGRGDVAGAQARFRSALALYRSIPHPPEQIAGAEMNLGLTQRFQGQPAAALASFQSAVRYALQFGGPNDPDLPALKIEAAYQRGLTGDAMGAEEDLRALRSEAETAQGGTHRMRALLALGDDLSIAGKPVEGEALLREALRYRLEHPPRDYRLAQTELALAECLEREGRTEEAWAMFKDASRDFRAGFGPNVWISEQAAEGVNRLSNRHTDQTRAEVRTR